MKKLFLVSLTLFSFATVVQGQKTNYSDETMSKVRQHNRHSGVMDKN